MSAIGVVAYGARARVCFAEEERRPIYGGALVREQGPAAAMNNDD